MIPNMSSRTDLFRRLRQLIHVAASADARGLSSADALAEARQATTRRGLSRRELIQGAGVVAAGALTARIMAPKKAWAAAGGNKPSAPDVAIVGAGMAGLTCADVLLGKGIAATLYEATQRAGGRIYSRGASFPGPGEFPGQVIELGGEFIDTTHGTMRAYANQFGFATEDVKTNPGHETFFVNGHDYSEEEVVDEWRALVPYLKEQRRLSSGGPTADQHSDYDAYLDHLPLSELLVQAGAGPIVRSVLDAAYTGEYGAEIANQSALNLLLFMHMDNRGKFKPFGVFSDERFHLVGGNEQIPRALAQRLDDQIEYGAWLTKVERRDSGKYRLYFRSFDGSKCYGPTWSSDHDVVVLAIPFSILKGVELDASLGLPDWKRYAIDNYSYGTNAKLMVSFTRGTWHDYDRSGASFCYGLPNVLNTWETNWSNASAQRAVLTDYTGGVLGANLKPNDASGEALKFLQGLDQVWPGVLRDARRNGSGKVVATLQHWPTVPTSRGSYTNNAPGYFTTIADNEAKPVGNLFFAGEHADSFYSWQGFMEGAALSGVNAATAIIKG